MRPLGCRIRIILLIVLNIAFGLSPLRAAEDGEGYLSITGPCQLQFPQDHGPHCGYRTEWWYYTGNLRADTGERFGFQLTFFRSRLSPPGAESTWPKPASAWRTQHIFLAHAALSDIDGGRFLHAEDMAREAIDIAGARYESETTEIFLKNWFVRLAPEEHHLSAVTDDFALNLTLNPLKAPVLHGDGGYSLKGSTPERSSCYYSFTRLEAQGTLAQGGRFLTVKGSAWMDHEFSSAPLESDLSGWDWFSLQLSDGNELMIYLLRKKDGGFSPVSSGTFVDRFGRGSHLSRDEFDIEVLDHWKSSKTGALYPSQWRIRVPSRRLDLIVVPNLADQELQTLETTQVTYWEGSVSVNAVQGSHPIRGTGYVELTGYERPFDAPL